VVAEDHKKANKVQEDLCTIIEDQLARVHKGDLAGCTTDVSNALIQFRDIAGILAADPGVFFDNLFRNENLSKFCYPCDTIELRTILTDETIYGSGNLAFLPVNFATHYFSSYSAFLLLNDIEAEIDLGALKIVNTNTFSIKDKLLGILVNGSRGIDVLEKVYRIVKECDAEVRVEPINQVPGICMPQSHIASVKTAEAVPYRVNIESLGIKGADISAYSAAEAVQKALNERWQQLYGAKVNRSEKFLVKNWMNSPFWNDIVQQADTEFNLKKFSASSEIALTDLEKSIFNLIKQVKTVYQVPVEARVAGGWVRDQLLGTGSDDIDIAVSHMSGFEFAQLIERFGKENGIDVGEAYNVSLEKEAEPTEEVKDPDLMVGGIKIFGQKVEFVPMRTETYREGSRKPIITRTDDVKEDVVRRDLTINAMYYNIDTGEVEDYVNGRQDLENMYLRTPTDPLKTFTDDPLRVMRALRFFSKYPNAQLDPGIVEAMQRPEVAEAYKKKVAPERVGSEMVKMMAGTKPAEAMRYLFGTGFYTNVFNVPQMEGLRSITMDQQTPHHIYNLMDHTLKVLEGVNASGIEKKLPPERRVARNLTALFHDFGKMSPSVQTRHKTNPNQMQYPGHEDESVKIADAIMTSMGIGPDIKKRVNKSVELHMRPHLHGEEEWTNRTMGRMLRSLEIPGQEAIAKELLEDLWDQGKADEIASDPATAKPQEKEQHYQQFVDFQAEQAQGATPIQKPILNGNEIMALIPELRPKTGFITVVNEKLLEQRYANPQMTKEDAITFVQSIKPDILAQFQQGSETMGSTFNFKHFKLAQNPMGQDSAGYEGFHAQEGGEERREQHDKSKPQPAISPYYKGQLVKMRRKGLSFGQIHGTIDNILADRISVKWDNEKESTAYPYDLSLLAMTLQRVN